MRIKIKNGRVNPPKTLKRKLNIECCAGDVYLFVGSRINKWKDKILEYYDPNNPTPEGIKAAKKHAKAERNAVKPAYLGWQYGLGAGTLHVSTGIPIEECKEILDDIDKAFPGVVKFNNRLKDEWEQNGGWVKQEWLYDVATDRNKPKFIDGRPGWIYNGRGRPLGVAADKVKDLGNRFVQTTGHDVLLQYLMILQKNRTKTMRPYNVDIHDATIWQVHKSEVEKAKKIMEDAYHELNNTLQWSVKIAGDVEVGDTWADFLEE